MKLRKIGRFGTVCPNPPQSSVGENTLLSIALAPFTKKSRRQYVGHTY